MKNSDFEQLLIDKLSTCTHEFNADEAGFLVQIRFKNPENDLVAFLPKSGDGQFSTALNRLFDNTQLNVVKALGYVNEFGNFNLIHNVKNRFPADLLICSKYVYICSSHIDSIECLAVLDGKKVDE